MPNQEEHEDRSDIPFADYAYPEFWRSVKNGNEHIFDDDAQRFLDLIVATSKERCVMFAEESIIWRAQRGCEWSTAENPFAKCHPPKRMIPDASFVGAGRANAAGKPVFYGSSDRDTAVKETRPWIGSLVSVARFQLKKELTLVNLVDAFQGRLRTFTHLGHQFAKTLTVEKSTEYAWHTIGEAFCEPVTIDDDPKGYLPTQILAELFRSAGFDGIAYRCAVDGMPPQRVSENDDVKVNVAIFDPSLLHMVDGDVLHVSSVDIQVEDGPHY